VDTVALVPLGGHAVSRGDGASLRCVVGSGVAVALVSRFQRIAGLAHIVLPSSLVAVGARPLGQCADTAIAALLDELGELGAHPHHLEATVVGGATLLGVGGGDAERNVAAVTAELAARGIPVLTGATGGKQARVVHVFPLTGKVLVGCPTGGVVRGRWAA